jgi:transcriptional regulator with XRE-family HTH domain
VITGSQIRGARAILGWSIEKLAHHAAVGTATILRIEHSGQNTLGRYRTLQKIQCALFASGIRFTEGAHGEHGVELIEKPQD